MKKMITVLFIVGLTFTSCISTDKVMKDILKNLEATEKNVQELVEELDGKKVNIKKIEKIATTGIELAEERDLFIEEYQDAYYKDEKGLHLRLDGFKTTIKKDKKYSEYQAFREQIKSLSKTAGLSLRGAIFTDLNGDGGKLPEIMDKGPEDYGTCRDIYNWYFINDFDEEISDFKYEVLEIDDFNGRLDLIEDYMKDNPWLLAVAKDYDSLFEYREQSKNSFWKTINPTLNMMRVGVYFSDILGPEEIREAIISNHS